MVFLTHTHHYVARVTQCKYKRIGCPWQGPFHELPAHESECSHPTKTGTELMGILGEMDQNHRRDMQLYNSIFSLLCYEKIGFTGTCKTKKGTNQTNSYCVKRAGGGVSYNVAVSSKGGPSRISLGTPGLL